MTLDEIMKTDKEMLTPSDVAEILGCDKYSINIQAAEDIKNGVNSFGFPVVVIRRRVKIPKRAFLKFMTGGLENG